MSRSPNALTAAPAPIDDHDAEGCPDTCDHCGDWRAFDTIDGRRCITCRESEIAEMNAASRARRAAAKANP